jgi:TRAP-type C4-dicarboxylate transport system permease small subunit
VADVIGRYLFNAPIPGAFEVIEILMGITIFAAIPVATVKGEHIVVDLLDPIVPASLTSALKRITAVLIGLVFATLTWLLWELGQRTAESGWVTDTLRIPLAPVGYFAALMTAVAALFALRRLWLHDANGN